MDDLLEYEGLVYSIINKYSKYFDNDDLYQVGMMGLVNAYKNFDNRENIKFSSYAYYYILGEVKKYIRETNPIKVSKDLIKLNNEVLRVKDIMKQKLGREATNLEVSLFLDIDEEKINEAELALQDIKSLDNSNDDKEDLYNYVEFKDIGMREDILDLHNELEKLSTEEQSIIRARYYNEMTQQETSTELGISQVQVSRKESKILEKLRTRL